MECRFYDAQVGQFISRDTDLSQKPYAYCDGDPVNCVDPTGHLGNLPTWRKIVATVAGLVGMLMGNGNVIDDPVLTPPPGIGQKGGSGNNNDSDENDDNGSNYIGVVVVAIIVIAVVAAPATGGASLILVAA